MGKTATKRTTRTTKAKEEQLVQDHGVDSVQEIITAYWSLRAKYARLKTRMDRLAQPFSEDDLLNPENYAADPTMAMMVKLEAKEKAQAKKKQARKNPEA